MTRHTAALVESPASRRGSAGMQGRLEALRGKNDIRGLPINCIMYANHYSRPTMTCTDGAGIAGRRLADTSGQAGSSARLKLVPGGALRRWRQPLAGHRCRSWLAPARSASSQGAAGGKM